MDKAELKPPHEMMLDRIESHCKALLVLTKGIREGGLQSNTQFVPAVLLDETSTQQIGGLCSLLDVLQNMAIPECHLEEVIVRLKALTYRHCMIDTTVENLEERRTAKVSG